MKGINKTEICQMIMDMDIEICEVNEEMSTTLDASSLEGRQYIYQRSGVVKIFVKGKMQKPDDQL